MTQWTITHQAPLFMEFSRQEYWIGLPFPSPGDLPDQGSNASILNCRQILYCLSHLERPYYPRDSQESSPAPQFKSTNSLVLRLLYGPTLTSVHAAAAAKSLQLCPTLCDPTDGSPPGSPVPGILQARTLKWVAISFSNA